MGNQKTLVRTLQKTSDDEQFIVKNAVLVRLMNVGQSIIWIDEQETILPGESFVETAPAGIHHSYQFTFLNNPNPPAINRPLVYQGNNLKIRVLEIIDQ